jgi:hypothetical protein
LTTGETLAYMPVNTGELVMVSDMSSGTVVSWGIATANWTDNGASCDHVTVNKCDDCEGTNPGAETLTVLLPKNGNDDGMDPNVVANAVIAYTTADDGTLVAVSDYLDDKIGTVKMWAADSGGTVPPGWAVMNGSANSVANGGSAVDMRDRFVRHGAPGAEGGKERHTHDLFMVMDVTFGEALSAILTVGMIIEPHTVTELEHVHGLFVDTAHLDGLEVTSHTPIFQTELCTGNPIAGVHEAAADPCPSGDWGPLNHRVTVVVDADLIGSQFESATADSYIGDAEHLPPYKTLLFIERLDNSA